MYHCQLYEANPARNPEASLYEKAALAFVSTNIVMSDVREMTHKHVFGSAPAASSPATSIGFVRLVCSMIYFR